MKKIVFGSFAFLIACTTTYGDNVKRNAFQNSFYTWASLAPPPEQLLPIDIGNHQSCPDDMVEVNGYYCTFLDQRCLEWRDSEQRVCLRFEKNYAKCLGSEIHMRFCADQFEIPNIPNTKPTLGMTYYDVENFCKSKDKRIGTDQEWTLAAEGNERSPYPHSWDRIEGWCNWDKPHIDVDEHKLFQIGTIRDAEIARLDQSNISGSNTNCYTDWGGKRLYDMQANADEWTKNVSQGGKPYIGLLKGGYWAKGLVRNRARPSTDAHGPGFNGYEVSGRCFKDIR